MHMNGLTQNLSRRRDISYHFLHAVDRVRPLESVNSCIFTLLGGFIQSEDHLYADDSRCISLFQTSLSPKLQVWIPDCSCVSILKQLINSSNITCLKTELLIFVTCPFLPPQSVPPPSFLCTSSAHLAALSLDLVCPESDHVSPESPPTPQYRAWTVI